MTAIENSPLRASRIAAFWYLGLAVFGAYGILGANAHFLVPGDAVATAALIRADGLLFRIGIASNLVAQVCFLFAGLAFYRLFVTVNKPVALTLVALVVAAVPIDFLNTVFRFAPLVLLGDTPYLRVFDPGQLQALALFFLKLQDYGTDIVGIFWGLWLFPLGLLTWQSKFLPKVLGALLVVNGLTYVVDSLLIMVFPDVHVLFLPVTTVLQIIGEIPFLLWLLVRGARSRPEKFVT